MNLLMTPAFIILSGFLMFGQNIAFGLNCVEQFLEITNGRTTAEKKKIIANLKSKTMKCLYENTSFEKLDKKFFWDSELYSQKKAIRFYGKNSLPVFNEFEKHFFEFKKNVYGYNVSSMGLLLRDPGMFALEIESSSKVTLNYKMDFSMIISLAEMLSWNDYPYKYVQNNKRSLLFKNLFDDMHFVDKGIAVGRAYKVKSNTTVKVQAYFLLLRLN